MGSMNVSVSNLGESSVQDSNDLGLKKLDKAGGLTSEISTAFKPTPNDIDLADKKQGMRNALA